MVGMHFFPAPGLPLSRISPSPRSLKPATPPKPRFLPTENTFCMLCTTMGLRVCGFAMFPLTVILRSLRRGRCTTSVCFSPDGNYLYFVRSEIGSRSLKYLYRAPVLGGAPQKLVTDIDTNITFSPDGQKFAYVLDNNPSSGRYRLIIHSLETAEEKDLTSGSLAEGLIDPAWSPDGKVIVCPIQQPGDALSGLVAVDVAKGKRNLFFTSKTRFTGSPVWLPDGTGLLILQNNPAFSRAQVAFVSYPGGKLFPVTRDTNNYLSLS